MGQEAAISGGGTAGWQDNFSGSCRVWSVTRTEFTTGAIWNSGRINLMPQALQSESSGPPQQKARI